MGSVPSAHLSVWFETQAFLCFHHMWQNYALKYLFLLYYFGPFSTKKFMDMSPTSIIFLSNLTFTEVFVYLIEPALGVLLSLSPLYFVIHVFFLPPLNVLACSQQRFIGFSPQAEPFTSKKEVFLLACCLTIFTEILQMFLRQLACRLELEPQGLKRYRIACILVWLPALAVSTCNLPLGLARRDRIGEYRACTSWGGLNPAAATQGVLIKGRALRRGHSRPCCACKKVQLLPSPLPCTGVDPW